MPRASFRCADGMFRAATPATRSQSKAKLIVDTRHLLTQLHGWGFGAVFVIGLPLALVAIGSNTSPAQGPPSHRVQSLLARGLWLLVIVGWITVLLGAYVIYPWYRAKPPAAADLALYPRSLLLSHPNTQWLHSFGMEWKEHVSWLAPIILTMAAAVYSTYGASLSGHKGVRTSVLAFVLVAFAAAGASGLFGLVLNGYAPIISSHQADRGEAE